jgi:UDP-N-acetylglucosamine acyltransferase
MNQVHPTAVIADGVSLGNGNVIGPYAIILGPARIGDGNWIGPHVVIGTPAEIRGIDHGVPGQRPVGTGVIIGHRNVIREYTTIHQGHYDVTSIGDDGYLMNKVYIGHDNAIGNGVTMASSVTLGGHVHIGEGANLGMGATVHQRRRIGPGCMIGMGAVVTRDIPPYALAFGTPCHIRGVNRVGMRRSGIAAETIDDIERAYAAGALPVPTEATAAAWTWWQAEQGSTSEQVSTR